jgi:hypothetical protein
MVGGSVRPTARAGDMDGPRRRPSGSRFGRGPGSGPRSRGWSPHWHSTKFTSDRRAGGNGGRALRTPLDGTRSCSYRARESRPYPRPPSWPLTHTRLSQINLESPARRFPPGLTASRPTFHYRQSWMRRNPFPVEDLRHAPPGARHRSSTAWRDRQATGGHDHATVLPLQVGALPDRSSALTPCPARQAHHGRHGDQQRA